ncbi:AfsR/SARP family transcriptional regulator [Micromonospora sp. WMMD1155]|uniref:AfsR/SARP family transcriptional regulator n=1 Tax=Micromonospora sp. WMMD1155 TaxID=3016094 RepID=UPI00249B5631|nr:AfsR/SARP family transcriptional regulator [Micromonospora sp. WMMD1155]WFE51668.1 AfsR/SARP family transcriptional regulator [Micromonospora sp. WMMD1155]
MSGQLRFEILGPQRAWYSDREIDLGPGKQRAVLTVLLLSAGRPVSTGQIIEAVWPEDPPANGPNVVQKYVAGLRRVLEPDRSPRTPGQVLGLTDAGYLLRVDPDALDAVRFQRGIHRARQRRAEGRATEALTELATALALWQGEPFGGFTGPPLEAARQRLVELRAVGLETRADLMLDLGRHREMVGELVELVAEFPVRERLRHQLMLALYRSGRQAEALAAYREFADLLREEHGIGPGEPLQELHRRILRSDPTLVVAEPPGEPESPRPLPTPSPPAPISPPAPTGSPEPTSPAAPTNPAAPASPPAPISPPAPTNPPAPPGLTGPMPAPQPVPSPPWAPRDRHSSRDTSAHSVPRWLSVTSTIVGTLTAVFSFGLLTWLVVLVYASWRRSWRNGLFAVAYLALSVTFIGVLGSGDSEEVTDAEGVLILAWLLGWLLGVLHTILLNGAIWSALTNRIGGSSEPVVDDRRVRREQARYLLYHYPAARQELHIGRPDLPRTFDDGGLVDVNAVQERTIAELPGVTAGQARQVVMDRWLRGPFGSMEDLAARCLLPPALTDSLRELLIFLPPPAVPAPPGRVE